MRQAFHDIAYLDSNFSGGHEPIPNPAVVCLGKDGCAEHEWGVAPLERSLDLPLSHDERLCGVEARRIRNLSQVVIIEGVTPKISASGRDPVIEPCKVLAVHLAPCTPYEGRLPEGGPLRVKLNKVQTKAFLEERRVRLKHHLKRPYSMWDEREAFFLVTGDEAVAALSSVLAGFEEEQGVALSSRARGAFNSGGGICLSRLSAISDEAKASVKKVDDNHWALKDRVSATGIEEKLKAAGRTYYALAPSFLNEERSELAFWLNPCEQRHNHYGWMSLTDLEAWATPEGGVIGHKAAEASLTSDESEYVARLTTRLSKLYGAPFTSLVVWANSGKTEAAVALSIGEKGIAAGLKHRQLVPLSQLEALVLQHEAIADHETKKG